MSLGSLSFGLDSSWDPVLHVFRAEGLPAPGNLPVLVPGMVPALFAEEEKESILSQIGQEALKQGIGPAKESVWQFFVKKSANNLHIVLGMSPVGDTLRTWCRNFPGASLSAGPAPWGAMHTLRLPQQVKHAVS